MTSSNKNDGLSNTLRNLVGDSGNKGITVKEIIKRLDLKETATTEVVRRLKSLSRSGEVVRVSHDRFSAPSGGGLVEGTLRFERGRFVVASSDHLLAIDPDTLGEAIGGDIVQVSIGDAHEVDPEDPGANTHRGAIVKITKKAPRTFYAIFRKSGRSLLAQPSTIGEPVVLLDADAEEGGYKVSVTGRADSARGVTTSVPSRPLLVELTRDQPSVKQKEAEEEFHENDGERIAANRAFSYVDKGVKDATKLIDQLSRGMSVDIPFSPEAVAESEAVDEPTEVPDDVTDLTMEPLITIDGSDAKDFDDAVAARMIGNDVELLVAIADVSAYVERGGILDMEARERGSSVYLPGRVYPMLPEHLSNGVCSLVPHRLRRCAWVRMRFGPRAGLKEYDLGFGILESKARLTYRDVQDYLEGDTKAVPKVARESVDALHEIYKRLNKKRRSRGMLDLDLGEAKIQLSEDGSTVKKVQASPRWTAHRLIEECMLVTNETIADFLASKKLPCIYRSHDMPDDDRIEQAFQIVEDLTDMVVPHNQKRTVERIAEALTGLEGHPLQRVASIAILKAMQRAEYSVETEGHFGIGARRYAHFTSPIRRYADLEVHRMLRAALEAPSLIRPKQWEKQLEDGAKAANAGDYRAVQAERYAERLMKARYMLDHVGDRFMGMVTGVTNFGTFVTLQDSPIEGLAHISGFRDDHYIYDEKLEQLKGKRKGRVIKLGQPIEVRCRRVTLHEGKVDFEPITWG